MEHINFQSEGRLLTVFLKGHIDSANAPAVEAEITQIRSESACGDLVLDARDLTYISSAGLRIILRLRKEFPALKIVNVSSEIY